MSHTGPRMRVGVRCLRTFAGVLAGRLLGRANLAKGPMPGWVLPELKSPGEFK